MCKITPDIIEYMQMSNLYAFVCTQQEEKYIGLNWGTPSFSYRWEDLVAAHKLMHEYFGADYWNVRRQLISDGKIFNR